jgi:RHS repeat-associated protein
MWTSNSDPFGTDAANPNPGGAGTFTYNLRFPGQIFDGQAGLHQNYYRDYDPAVGRFAQSDPSGLGGGLNTYNYSGGNPLSNFDPLGRYCTSSGGMTNCSYPGGPSFQIPTPIGFPPSISDSSPLYHRYDVSVSTKCPDSNMLQALINSPAPGNPIFPASANGTPNVAQAFGVDNPIRSYVTTDVNTGNTIVVNVTNSTGGFSPGYVARTVSNGVVNNYGEGLALAQSPLLFSPEVNFLLDQFVWRSQTNSAAKQCGCN